MTEAVNWIGIDLANGWLDVADTGAVAPWRAANDAAGTAAVVEGLTARQPRLIVLEPTGGARDGLRCRPDRSDWRIS